MDLWSDIIAMEWPFPHIPSGAPGQSMQRQSFFFCFGRTKKKKKKKKNNPNTHYKNGCSTCFGKSIHNFQHASRKIIGILQQLLCLSNVGKWQFNFFLVNGYLSEMAYRFCDILSRLWARLGLLCQSYRNKASIKVNIWGRVYISDISWSKNMK